MRCVSWATLDLISGARRLSTAPFHDAVKSFETGASLAILKKTGCFKRRNFFRHSHRDELVNTGTFFLLILSTASFKDRGRRNG